MSESLDARRFAAAVAALATMGVALLESDPAIDVAGAAALVGIHPWRIYAAWTLVHPDRPPRGRGCRTKASAMSAIATAQAAPFAAFCDAMLDHVGRDHRYAGEIFAAVADDYGHPAAMVRSDAAAERRLYRGLARLVERGLVTRHGTPGSGTPCTYTRSRQ